MALTQVKTDGIATDAVTGAKIADDSVNSEHLIDASIDNAHIADDQVNSEHYAAGSIDHEHLADDCVDGDNIADNSVGLAAMAAGTDGQIITYDASGDPVAVGPGTDGQVLTSTGAGSPPAFEDVPAGGATINNATENELVTVASTTSQLDAEAKWFINSDQLLHNKSAGVTACGHNGVVQIFSTGANESVMSLVRHKTNEEGPVLTFNKSRNATPGSFTICQDDDVVGDIRFGYDDGNDFGATAAAIRCKVDGTPGSNDTPARLEFHTCNDDNGSATEWYRITREGRFCFMDSGVDGSGEPDCYFQSSGGDAIKYVTNGTTRVNWTNNQWRFGAEEGIGNNSSRCIFYHANANSTYLYINNEEGNNARLIKFEHNSGGIGDISQDGSNTHYGTGSDYRRKQDDVKITNGITKLKELRPIRFKWKDDLSRTVDGFFAHEVQAVIPEAVKGAKDAVVTQAMVDAGEEPKEKLGEMVVQTLDTSRIIPVLTAALQESVAKIENLETRMAAQESS
tara:strand:- start:804 stop:2339 length:1536 start_codon:yes stop_codon:yes gene_type:complete